MSHVNYQEYKNSKICPILTLKDDSKLTFCAKEECSWWDKDGKQCALTSLTDIADVMWNDDDLTKYADTHQEEEIQKLQVFLMRHFQGELISDKTPVENAIEIIKKANEIKNS